MKKILTIIIFIISITTYSQSSIKKRYYYFQQQKITKVKFESLDKRKIYIKKIENDTIIIKNIFLRKKKKTLDSIQHYQFKKILKSILGSRYNPEIKTMIHLYSHDNESIYKDSKHKKYWKWINNNSNRYQSFLIGTKDSQLKVDKHIFLDNDNLIKRLFFKNSDFKINHLLIKPNGEIYIYFGSENILSILDWSVD